VRQKDHEFKVSLGYIARPCLQNKTKSMVFYILGHLRWHLSTYHSINTIVKTKVIDSSIHSWLWTWIWVTIRIS
jgi:hypothetical protein